MPIELILLKKVFKKTMHLFFQNEVQEVLNNVNERNNCGRMAFYMQQVADEHGLRGYFADTEYNRKQNGALKTILNGAGKTININCDLILHSRGQIVAQDNLIAIEVKKVNAKIDEKDKDRDRLCALTKTSYNDIWSADGTTLPEHVCGYVLGVFIELDRKNRICRYEYYRQGAMYKKRTHHF